MKAVFITFPLHSLRLHVDVRRAGYACDPTCEDSVTPFDLR